MRRIGAGLVFALLPLVAPVVAAADQAADSLRAAEVAFARSVAERDLAAFTAAIAEEAIFLGAGAPMKGRDAIVEAWAPFFAENGPRIEWHPEIAEVQEGGRLGITRGPYSYTAPGPDGQPVTAEGTFTSVWRREEDGSWRVVFDSGCPPCPKCEVGD